MKEIKIKALGQTVEHNGEVVLVSNDLPANCMVLFVSMEVWQEIKAQVELEEAVLRKNKEVNL